MKMFDARPVSYDSDGVPLFIAPIHPELPDDKTLERIRKDMYSRSPLLLRPRQSHSIYTPVNVYPPVDLPRSDSICEHTEIQQARKDSVDQQSGITAVTLTESAERPAFPTPSNKSFSSRFKYHSLDASRQEIRLLKVHPKRLFIDEIPEVFPNWSHLNQQHMRCYPPNGRLESAKQPVFDSVHAQAIAHGRIDPQHLPLDFDFAGKSLPSVDACQLPFGWGMARGLTPYWYLNESYTADDPDDEFDWKSSCSMRNYVGNLKTIFFKTAWYYVNLYTGDTTWKRPIKQAPGSPRLMPDGLICCELVDEVPLDTLAQPYSALSYCAGSPEDTRPILVNGYMFNAFANLEHSIDCLRQRPVKNTNLPLLLWTDQVCINQSDNQEKAHQVGFMRQIYEQAEEVLIVLSTADTSTFALTTAPQGAEAMEHCHRMTQMALPNDSGGTELKERYQTELMHQFTKETTEQSTKYEENTLISLLQQIAGSPWWTRAWVFQEFIVACRAHFIYGPQVQFSWLEARPWLRIMCTAFPNMMEIRAGSSESPMRPPSTSEDDVTTTPPGSDKSMALQSENASVCQDIDSHADSNLPCETEDTPPRKLRGKMALVQRRIEQLLVATAAQRQSIMYSVDAKEAWTGSANLYDLLKNSYRFNAGDPRDIVYAFLGLVDPSYTFEADYSPSMSPIQTFVQATEKVIRAENSLAVLRQTVLQARDNHGLWLPSWAPDWTSGATIGPHYMEMRSVMSGSFIRFRQLPKSLSLIPIGVAKVEWDVTGRTLAKLMVRALLVGTLLEVVHDDYGWSRVFRIDTSPEFKVVTSAQGRSKQQVWVIDGAPGFFVLRRQQQGTYSVVHAAGIYIVSRDNMEAESRAIYESVVEAENRGERSPEILSLI